MILEIQHETRFEYSDATIESLTELRMEPMSDEQQSCHSFHLGVTPPAEMFRYVDGFGNRVHHFNLLVPHALVRILARASSRRIAMLRTWPRARRGSPTSAPICRSTCSTSCSSAGRSARPRCSLPCSTALRPSPGKPVAQIALDVARYIRQHFEYARDATLATSPIDDVLRQGKGVCQDFAHLMIAVLRSFGVPARYVSGYIHRPNKESQSHAWCEAWLPDAGWIGVDPTNDQLVDDHFVKVAIGRDFTDVPPNKGVYRTTGRESISVRVETRELARLPSLSWQEQLPPLNVPLQAILVRTQGPASVEEEAQQQQ